MKVTAREFSRGPRNLGYPFAGRTNKDGYPHFFPGAPRNRVQRSGRPRYGFDVYGIAN